MATHLLLVDSLRLARNVDRFCRLPEGATVPYCCLQRVSRVFSTLCARRGDTQAQGHRVFLTRACRLTLLFAFPCNTIFSGIHRNASYLLSLERALIFRSSQWVLRGYHGFSSTRKALLQHSNDAELRRNTWRRLSSSATPEARWQWFSLVFRI